MTKQIGRQYSIGLGKETTRGTAVAATFWLPKTAMTLDDRINYIVDDSSIGIIEDGIGQDISGKGADISIEGRIYMTSFGMLVTGALGTEANPALVSGETVVYDHAWTVLESAQHPTFTISASDPNSPSSGAGLQYTLAVVDSLEIDFEVDKFLTHKTTMKANSNTAASVTPSFSAENGFKPQDITVKFAATLSALSGGTAVTVKKGTFMIKKNVEEDYVVGSVTAADRLNKEFHIEGTLELFYQDRIFIDTDMLASLAQAMQITAINTDVTLGVASNPTFTIQLAKVKIQSVAKKYDNGSIVSETVKYQAFYSISDTQMVNIALRNLRSTKFA